IAQVIICDADKPRAVESRFRVVQLSRDLDRLPAMFKEERKSLRHRFGVSQGEQRLGLHLQVVAPFAVADEFVSERGEVPGLAFLPVVVAGEAQRGHLRVRVISYTFGGVERLREDIASRASITARMLLPGML